MTPDPMPTITRVIKRRRVHVSGVATGTSAGAGGATARLVRAGDAVRAIVVDCACGRSIELECSFAPPAASPLGAKP